MASGEAARGERDMRDGEARAGRGEDSKREESGGVSFLSASVVAVPLAFDLFRIIILS